MAESALNQEAEEVTETTDEALTEDVGGSENEETESSETEEETISSLAQLAEHLEADPDWISTLKVSAKVDGQPAETTIKDLIDSYQIQEAATHRLAEAKSKAQAINQEVAQHQEKVKQELGQAAAVIMLADKMFLNEIEEADLAKLRESDKERYLIEKDRLTEKRGALNAAKQQISAELQKYLTPQPLKPEQVEEVRTEISKAIPELATDEGRLALAEYAISQGYTREELAMNADPRLYILGEKARRYDELQGKTETAKKKVAKIPKVLKPGANKAPDNKPKDAAEILYS